MFINDNKLQYKLRMQFKTHTKNKCSLTGDYDKNYLFLNKTYKKYKTNIIVFIFFLLFLINTRYNDPLIIRALF